MLVARRDPFHPGAHEAALAHDAGSQPPRLARTVTMLQVVGSLLAIPVGLASAYSIYRANFSAETTCQGLRSNIISMIDKRIDAGARRILVRRDVEKFEQTCASVDPDATLAFKELLSADKTAAAPAVKVQHSELASKEPVHKIEPPVHEIARRPPAAAAGEAVREHSRSDVQWVDAVRQALLIHGAGSGLVDPSTAPAEPKPSLRPSQQDLISRTWTPPVAAPAPAPVILPAQAAPPAIAAVPAALPRGESDHPVPSAVIPDPVEAAAAKPAEPRSRIGRWIAQVPLLGPAWENSRN